MNTTINPPSSRTVPASETPDHQATDTTALQLVTFRVGNVSLGIDIAYVQEINRLTEVTPVPESSDRIHGVVNLRGEVMTVIDAHQVLQLPRPDSLSHARNVILNLDGERIGILVDEISDILAIDRSDLASPPSNLRSVDRKFMDSVYLRDHALIVVLDPAGLLAAISNG